MGEVATIENALEAAGLKVAPTGEAYAVGNAVLVERNVMVAMRDGVRLATDIYRPADTDRHPVLVQRTPYSKSNAWFVGGLIFNPLDAVGHGYVVIVQDTRGRARSEGDWLPFVNEAADGYDTVEWAAVQPWADGNVGVLRVLVRA